MRQNVIFVQNFHSFSMVDSTFKRFKLPYSRDFGPIVASSVAMNESSSGRHTPSRWPLLTHALTLQGWITYLHHSFLLGQRLIYEFKKLIKNHMKNQ